MELKYGVNPYQKPARVGILTAIDNGQLTIDNDSELPFAVLNGKPGYINLLDALNSWQLVRELKVATGKAAAASFKHVSPAGAAIAGTIAEAYRQARYCDPVSSYGDWIALSDTCDEATAKIIRPMVSDGIIAPGFSAPALEILKGKKKGNYTVLSIDANYEPPEIERKDVFGVTFEQARNNIKITRDLLKTPVTKAWNIPDSAKLDLLVAMITLKYTQSNSVCYALDGKAIGIGAGQQSRLACTQIAGDKADEWLSRNPPAKPSTRQEIALASDAFFPFADNIDRAAKSGVKYIAQPGGSIRDVDVIYACDKYGIAMCFTDTRLFQH
ncbi:MAG: phosphoribosylaminoimidazolecarboxamide formyltransferase [Oscillospiraceae bacterium]|jgi:AICAR transformylase/IMP cyclohydrolase PurH|nr:phosphoribosylaminoimidazolecarboxamide formyltransferase [Oscillospiraceae bacterium]